MLIDGKELNQFEYQRWHFDGRSARLEQKSLDGSRSGGEYAVNVNPTTDPPEMHMHNKHTLLLAVYQQDGDRMKIAVLSRSEIERPRSFDPKDIRVRGLGLIVWEMARQK